MISSLYKYPFYICLGAMLCAGPQWLRAEILMDRIVAVVNDEVVMLSELENKLRTVRNQIKQQGGRPPPAAILEKQVLDNLIQNKLQLQLAAINGITVGDEPLNRTITNIAAENNLSLDEFRATLEDDGYNFERFREEIRDTIIISRLRQRNVTNKIVVSEREIDNFLANQEFQGETDAEFRLAHILIALSEGASAEDIQQARVTAENVRQAAVDGKDFAALAKAVSDGNTAQLGGDLGWRKMTEIPSLFSAYAPNMQPGEVSELIQSPGGFHIIKLVEARLHEAMMVEQTRARHVLIRVDRLTTDEEAKKTLEQLKSRITGGDDFGAIAKAHSDDPVSAANDGDLGWANPGQFVPQFEDQMNRLQIGEMSEPFKSTFGWHIVQVMERREHDNTELVKRGRARAILHKRKEEEAQQNWLRAMRDEAFVEYRLE